MTELRVKLAVSKSAGEDTTAGEKRLQENAQRLDDVSAAEGGRNWPLGGAQLLSQVRR
jgi:hypothetical protein